MEAIFERFLGSDHLIAAVLSVGLTALVAIVARFLAAKPRIHWALMHENMFLFTNDQGQPISAYTRNLTVRNSGRATASDVEVVFNYEPQNFHIYPHIPVDTAKRFDGRLILTFKSLNSREFINIALLNVNAEPPAVTNVRWNGGVAKEVIMIPQRLFPGYFNITALILMIIGILTAIYITVRLII